MKKYLAVIAVITMLVFAGTAIAEEVFAPGKNNSGTIGSSSRSWRKGYFQSLYIAGGTLTSTADIVATTSSQTLTNKTLLHPILASNDVYVSTDQVITFPSTTDTVALQDYSQTLTNKTLTSPTITSPSITSVIASHDYSAATTDWTLSATEKASSILLVKYPALGTANIIAPSEVRTYWVVNQSTQDITIKATGKTGIVIPGGANAAMVGFITADYIRFTPNTSYGS
jgi:hypothetical protein